MWDGFELAVLTVLGEQLTVNASSALAGRFVQTFGRPLQTSTPGLTHLFPRPQDIVAADLSRAGIRGARAATLHALARAVCGGKLTFAASMTLEEAIRRICGIPGIGESTAHYIAIRALGEPDAFPSADPNLRSRLGVGAHPASLPQVLRIAEGWRPWRAYAAMHIGAAPPG